MIAKPIRPGRAARQRARLAARAVGCTCRPDVELVRHFSDHAHHVRAFHDDDCPAADAAGTLAVWS